MNDNTTHIIDQLTQPGMWNQKGNNPPLLDMLKTWIRESKTNGSGSHTHGIKLNTQAAELHTTIKQTTQQWRNTHNMRPIISNPTQALKDFWEQYQALYRHGRTRNNQVIITDTTNDHICQTIKTWHTQIIDILEPPRIAEATECPACGATSYNDNGQIRAPVTITQRDGYTPYAECHACKKTWLPTDNPNKNLIQ